MVWTACCLLEEKLWTDFDLILTIAQVINDQILVRTQITLWIQELKRFFSIFALKHNVGGV